MKRFIGAMLKPFMREYVLNIIEGARIKPKDFSANTPIIILQMGKVASTTVYETLRHTKLKNPIYHVHFLSHDGIKNTEAYIRHTKYPLMPRHLIISKILRKKIDGYAHVQWPVITLVRDPIMREISDIFQNARILCPALLNSDGSIKKQATIEFLQKKFESFDESTNYTCTWFDREMKNAFNIDIYNFPFNHAQGFSIISKDNVKLLALRVEDLNNNLRTALVRFMETNRPFTIWKANVGEDKKYSQAYKHVIQNIIIPKSVCAKIYNTKFARHFYSANERNTLIQKWCREQ